MSGINRRLDSREIARSSIIQETPTKSGLRARAVSSSKDAPNNRMILSEASSVNKDADYSLMNRLYWQGVARSADTTMKGPFNGMWPSVTDPWWDKMGIDQEKTADISNRKRSARNERILALKLSAFPVAIAMEVKNPVVKPIAILVGAVASIVAGTIIIPLASIEAFIRYGY